MAQVSFELYLSREKLASGTPGPARRLAARTARFGPQFAFRGGGGTRPPVRSQNASPGKMSTVRDAARQAASDE